MSKTKLRLSTRRWINQIIRDYELESHHLHLLELIGAAWDRSMEARETLEAEGSFIFDRFGIRKVHPAVDMEQRTMINFSRLLRELGLDLEPPVERRPPRQY